MTLMMKTGGVNSLTLNEARKSGLLDPEDKARNIRLPDLECELGRADSLILKMKPGRVDCLTLKMKPGIVACLILNISQEERTP